MSKFAVVVTNRSFTLHGTAEPIVVPFDNYELAEEFEKTVLDSCPQKDARLIVTSTAHDALESLSRDVLQSRRW